MSDTLKLVLTDHWFEEIKSGRKTHEYRKFTKFWDKRIGFEQVSYCHNDNTTTGFYKPKKVEFQKAYRKNAEKMLFEIENIVIRNGLNTDLHIDEPVFDIELGDRIDE